MSFRLATGVEGESSRCSLSLGQCRQPDQVGRFVVRYVAQHVSDGMARSYSVYNAVEKAPTIALGTQHGMLFSAYGELRVRPGL